MKKVLACLLIVLMLALPTACGESPDDIITFEIDTSPFDKALKGMFPTELVDNMKEDGFISIEKKADELVEYKIKRGDYDAFLARYKQTRVDILEKYNNSDSDSYSEYIDKVEYNDDLTVITITCDKAGYDEKSIEYGSAYRNIQGCAIGCANNISVYQQYNIHSNRKCTIKLKDRASDEIFSEKVYPDSYNKY